MEKVSFKTRCPQQVPQDPTRAAEFHDRKNKIDDERNRNAIDVLTEAQRQKYDDLVGIPVEAAKPPSSVPK